MANRKIMYGMTKSNGNDLEWSWWPLQLFETFLNSISRKTKQLGQHVARICFHTNSKACVAHNFNYCIKTERLLKVTGSHERCKSGNISETVPDRDILLQNSNRKWRTIYRIAPFPITMRKLCGQSLIASLFKCDSPYATVVWLLDRVSFQPTESVAQSLCNSWASCLSIYCRIYSRKFKCDAQFRMRLAEPAEPLTSLHINISSQRRHRVNWRDSEKKRSKKHL